MAQRGSGREACLAGVNVPAVFGCDTRQVEDLDLAGLCKNHRQTVWFHRTVANALALT